MSKATRRVQAQLLPTRIMLKEPMNLRAGTEITSMGPGGSMGTLVSVCIKWGLNGEVRDTRATGREICSIIEHAQYLFIEDVYGEFRRDLYDLRMELSKYMDSEDARKKLDSIIDRMFTI